MSTDFLQRLFSLEGELAVVTGGTRGIGQKVAIGLAEAGADIVLVQRDVTNTKTKSIIDGLPSNVSCRIIYGDMSKPDTVKDVIPLVEAEMPNRAIGILANCAGIQKRSPAVDFTDADWADVIQTNLTAVFTLCRAAGGHMIKRESPSDITGRKGTIINVASLLSYQGGITVPAYAASKGGVLQLTKALSNEWTGQGVNVVAIAPGYIETDMTEPLRSNPDQSKSILGRIPAGRWGKPSDFVGVVVFLASRAAEYVAGECLSVDGGWMGY